MRRRQRVNGQKRGLTIFLKRNIDNPLIRL